jgi:hypothetical protein
MGRLFDRLFGLRPAGPQFDQAGQRVGAQVNTATHLGDTHIGDVITYTGRAKIPPHVERFSYRIDRTPQCTALREALLARLSDPARRDRPLCAIACGTEDDLPSTLGTSLLEHVQREVLHARRLRPFSRAKTPVCRTWPDSCLDSEHLWNAIGTVFLDLAALETPQDARSALERRDGSVAFGFEINVAAWGRHAPTLASWIDDLNNCRAPPQGVALAIIVLCGPKSAGARLEVLHKELTARYRDHASVLMLPILGPVEYNEFKVWHRELISLIADDAYEGDLATMTLELFPDETVQRRMGEIWGPVRSAVREAWSGA